MLPPPAREGIEALVGAGWRALSQFGARGRPALDEAVAAFRKAEPVLRSPRNDDALVVVVLGEALALRLSRRPEMVARAVIRAQELVNLSRRVHGEAASLRHHAQVELAWRDLADVDPAQRDSALAKALDLNGRTLKAAKTAAPDLIASETAIRADLLLRRARASSPPDARTLRRAVSLYDGALRAWPRREEEGRGQVVLGLAESLVASGKSLDRAESLLRDALALFEQVENRVLEARARALLATLLARQDRDEALVHQERAVALYRDLQFPAQRREAERIL